MKVRFRVRALNDIDAIYQWLSQHSLALAKRTEAAMLAAAELLVEHPELGALAVGRWQNSPTRCFI